MNEGINRRKFPRVQCKCRSSINCTQGIKVLDAITENISTGGLCVVFNEDVGLFNEVAVQLFLEKKQIQGEGTIVWILKKKNNNSYVYETGIEFSKIDEIDKKLLCEKVNNVIKEDSIS